MSRRRPAQDVVEAVFEDDSEDGIVEDDSDCDSDWEVENNRNGYEDDSEAEEILSSESHISPPQLKQQLPVQHGNATKSPDLATLDVSGIDSISPSTSYAVSTPLPAKKKTTTKTAKSSKPVMTWQAEKDNDLSGTAPGFTGNHHVNLDLSAVDEPVDIFLKFLSDDLLDEIVYQSNLYASQTDISNPLNLTRAELYAFLGINIVMTFIRYPRYRLYWSSDSALRCNMIADAMPVNRFERIRRFLHFTDNTKHDKENTDRLWKVRAILDHLNKSFKDAVSPEEFQSIDEMMIPFKGNAGPKQYIRNKPKPWGYKVWARSGVSGYVYDFEVYQGARANRPEISSLGSCADVVLRLCDGLEGKSHKVYFDNLFTTLDLLDRLASKKIYAIGTLRKNRLLGAGEALKSDKHMKDRGSISVATNEKNITVTKWNDNNFVYTASTYAGAEPMSEASRWDKKRKERVCVSRPYAIELYNKHMGGMDLTDFLVSCYRHNLKQKRWYMRIFFHFINLTITNSWISSKWTNQESSMDLLEFRSKLAHSLISKGRMGLTRKRKGRPISNMLSSRSRYVDSIKRYDLGLGHWAVKQEQLSASRCKSPVCSRRTRYKCSVCECYLCPECFEVFHSK